MPEPLLLCVLPAERARLAQLVLSAGGTPVIDLTCASLAAVPDGAWVRTRPGRPAPGNGPVILVEGAGAAEVVPGRPTWLERARPGPVPPGFAGVVLRGAEAGGLGGDRPGLDLLAEQPSSAPVILDAGLSPLEAGRAFAEGAAGVVLSDVLLALPEMSLPPGLASALASAGADSVRRVRGIRVLAPPAAPVLSRLAAGASLWDQAEGWFSADNPIERAWPVGTGLVLGRALTARYTSLAGLLNAYRSAIRAAAPDALSPIVEAALPSLRELVSAVAASLSHPPAPAAPAAPAAGAPSLEVVCTGLAVGLPGGETVFADDNLAVLARGVDRLRPLTPDLVEQLGGRVARVGRPGRLDLAQDYGVERELGLDPGTRLAVAVGFEALADARIPLVRDPALPSGRGLPPALRDGTGVIFASALPGLVRLLLSQGEVSALSLAEAHAVLAGQIGAAGPSVAVNAGSASASVALALAYDWIRAGRAERVVVIASDDPADEVLLESLGPALVLAGQPVSVGAAGFVLEAQPAARARGRAAVARLADARVGTAAVGAPRELRDARPAGSGVLLERGGAYERVTAVDFVGDSLGAGLDDALALVAIGARQAAGRTFEGSRALRLAQGPGGPVLLVWERPAPVDLGSAAEWLGAVTRLKNPTLARAGRLLVVATERAPAAPPAPVVPAAPAVPAVPVVPAAPAVPAPPVVPTPPAASAAPAAPSRPLLPPDEEDASDQNTRPGSGRLAAWSRRLRKRGRKGASETQRSDGLIERARLRVRRDLLFLLGAPAEEDAASSPERRLGADFGLDATAATNVLELLGERHDLDLDVSELLTDDPPLDRIVARVVEEAESVWTESPEAPAGVRRLFALDDDEGQGGALPLLQVRASGTVVPTSVRGATGAASPENALAMVTELVAAEAGYRPSELRSTLELSGDLGLDDAARARILAALRLRFELPDFTLDEEDTLASLARKISESLSPEPVAAPPAPEPAAAAPARPAPEVAPPAAPRGPARLALPPSFRVRRPVRVVQPLSALGSVRGRVVRVLGGGPLAEAVRRELVVRGARLEGRPDAVVDMGEDPHVSYEAAHALAAQPPRDWLCVTRQGEAPADPAEALAAGGRAGIAKALRREWPGCRGRVVDLAPSLDLAEAVLLTLEELAAGDDAIEVWREAGPRKALALRSEGSPPPAGWPGARPTVLIAGGTRGIGARVALALARRARARLVLLARTPPARKPYDEAAARAAVERALRARGRRPSEARILRGLESYRMAEEARLNVLRMREAGAEVIAIKADLGDAASVGAALAEVRKVVGAVDGAVLALPVGDTHPLGSREAAFFASAFAPRAVGAAAIARELPPDAWLLSVGSVAGRFGQAGRVDLCAAHQAMAAFCAASPRALHVACPAWLDGGRADESPGADALPVEAGVDLLLDLVAGGVRGELVLSGRLGAGVLSPGHPLLDGMDVEGDSVEAWRRVSPDDDPWLADHALGGVPFLPASVAAELMAAAARAALPGQEFTGLLGLRLDPPLRVPFGAEARVVVTAEPEGEGRVRAALYAEHTGPGGRAERTRHADGLVLLGPTPAPSVLPPAFFPEEGISRSQTYRRFYQGSTFQVLRDAGAVAAEGLLADAVAEHALLATDLVAAPLVLEAAIQGALLHHMAVDGIRCVPLELDGAWLVRTPTDGDPLELMVQRVGDAYDIDVHGPEGAVLRVRGLRLADLEPLGPDERFPEPDGGWPSAVVGLTVGG